MALFTAKWTLITFAVVTFAALALSLLLGLTRVGAQTLGFPFTFYASTSAPTSMFGNTTWAWKRLIADLLIYYFVAVCAVFLLDVLGFRTAAH